MYINPAWRILTVGDGDLSFSASLVRSQSTKNLHASVLDSVEDLRRKYPVNGFDDLVSMQIPVHHQLDICQPQHFPTSLRHQFDLLIFHFPLLPNFHDKNAFLSRAHISNNTLNRMLLRQFIDNGFTYFLDPQGANLAYVTSKDVKPYSHWNIENLMAGARQCRFLGQTPFQICHFPGYRVRNVDRDKTVKDTQAITYAYGNDKSPLHLLELQPSVKHQAGHCSLCGKGPFKTAKQFISHQQSKLHRKLMDYEMQWQNFQNSEQ